MITLEQFIEKCRQIHETIEWQKYTDIAVETIMFEGVEYGGVYTHGGYCHGGVCPDGGRYGLEPRVGEVKVRNGQGNIYLYVSDIRHVNMADIKECLKQYTLNNLVKCAGSCNKFIPVETSNQWFTSFYCDECFTDDMRRQRDGDYQD